MIKFRIYSGLKAVIQVGVEGTYLSIIKTVYDKPTAQIILSGKTLPTKFRDQTRSGAFRPVGPETGAAAAGRPKSLALRLPFEIGRAHV